VASLQPVKLSVVMPAFNEASLLEPSVNEVVAGRRVVGGAFEVLIVENGSTDGTDAIARELAASIPEVTVHELPTPDYGAAIRAGLLASTGDVVVLFDVDYFDLDFVDAAIERLARDDAPAIVVGSKRAVGADDQRSSTRRFVTFIFAAILRIGFGLRVSDTHGMKAFRRAPVVGLVPECQLGTDLFDTELILRAQRSGLLIAELPVVVVERRPSRTGIWVRVPRTLWGLVRLRVALWRGGPVPAGTGPVASRR
jgi:glycosyltransferase involved in cell wall biosynthesis